MKIISPRTPQGVMELLPREQIAFQHMLDVIRGAYESFGFLPIETPVFETRDVLLTKSGGETEKQVYFAQSTGALAQGHEPDMALRFDLTVPLARYVAEHERELVFPFRRYQMQRVYRGERPQKGRFREFYQCDIDIIGKDRLDPIYDAEVPAVIAAIFTKLGVGDFTIRFSNRKILCGWLAAHELQGEQQAAVLRELDKLDKIGADKVLATLLAQGLDSDKADALLRLVSVRTDNASVLTALRAQAIEHPLFLAGCAEATAMVAALSALGVPESQARLDLGIVRGLDYYTGTVYETQINAHPEFGSVCSGGRYDDLAGHYTKSVLPGVGISIGATRLFDLLRQTGWTESFSTSVKVMIAQMHPELRHDYFALATALRQAGLNTEIYLEPAKLDKQLRYADRAGIPNVVLLGENEKASNTVIVKSMRTQQQQSLPMAELQAYLLKQGSGTPH
jgi:histidyl-tRNA synthetase